MSRIRPIPALITFLLALMMLNAASAVAAVVYVGPNEANTTLKQAFAVMKRGDILVIRDGTYTGEDNRITPYQRPPDGPGTGSGDGRFTTVRAEHVGEVYLKQSTGRAIDLGYTTASWLQFDGLVVSATGETDAECYFGTGDGASGQNHHIYIRRSGFVTTRGGGNSANIIGGGDYLLVEDCYFWGRARYGLAFRQPGRYHLARRVVFRMDDVDGGGLGASGTTFYGTRSGALQNSIVVDQDGSYYSNMYYPYMGMLGRDHDYSNFPAANLTWVGNIVLNLKQPSTDPNWSIFAYQAVNNYQFENSAVRDSVAWDIDRGMGVGNFSREPSVNPSYRGLTFGNIKDTSQSTTGYGFYQLGSTPIKNTLVYGVRATAFYDAIGADYVNAYGNGSNWTYTPAHSSTVNPLTNGLKYLPRIEEGSFLKTAGEDGGQIGAQVVKRIGLDGTFYGEQGFDTVTDVDLWPFPNEDVIRAKMRAYVPTYVRPGESVPGPNPRRGFCADGQTLTNYIWGYLGNAVPPLGLIGTPGDGSITLNWARPADIALQTITGFNIYRVDGGQRALVGTVSGNATYTATVTGLDPAESYAFAMTTVDSRKGESGLSETAVLGTPDSGAAVSPPNPETAPKTTPAINWASPAAITQGTPLGATQLSASTAAPGTFTYSPAAGTVLAAGTHTLTALFTPSDATLYTTATAYMSLTVNPASKTTPTVSWTTPAAIAQGTPLGSTQLNATASVPGTFTYSPAAGTVLAAGTHSLTAAFTPSDTTRYGNATATRSLTVNPVTYRLTVTRPGGGTVKGAGINCGVDGTACQVTMTASMSLGLQATAATGYAFSNWTGDCSGTNPGFTLQLNGSKSCGAAFAAVPAAPATGSPETSGPSAPAANDGALPIGGPYTLKIVRPSGGVVRAAGIICGTKVMFCEVTMPAPMTVGIQATADAGYTFLGWTGNCSGTSASYAMMLEGPRTCGASFVQAGGTAAEPTTPPPTTTPTTPSTGGTLPMGAPYTLTITRPSGGMVQAAGINCGTRGSNCSVTMPAAMRLGLQATPDRGYVFTGWTGHCSGTSFSLALTLAGPRTCSATFKAAR